MVIPATIVLYPADFTALYIYFQQVGVKMDFCRTATGISIHTSRLLPDIFTPLSILCISILLVAAKLTRLHIIIVSVLFVFANMAHLSNLIILLVMLSIISLFNIVYRKKYQKLLINNRRIYFGWGLLLLSWLLSGSINFLYTKTFFISRGSHVFIMSRMSDNGILQQYLKDKCSEKNYKICNYRDSIPWDFIWDTKGPLYKTYNLQSADANWSANKKEYWDIITGTLTEPRYLKMHFQCILETTLEQLGKFDSGMDIIPHTTKYPVLDVINWRFPRDVRAYLSSMQSFDKLTFSSLHKRQRIIVFLSLALLCVCVGVPTIRHSLINTRNFAMIIMVLSSLVVNAIVCSNLSAPDHRFQGRVIWLLPFCVLLLIANRQVRSSIVNWIKNLFLFR